MKSPKSPNTTSLAIRLVRVGKTHLKILRTPLWASLAFRYPPCGENYNLVTCLGKQWFRIVIWMEKESLYEEGWSNGGAYFLSVLHHFQNHNLLKRIILQFDTKQTKLLNDTYLIHKIIHCFAIFCFCSSC